MPPPSTKASTGGSSSRPSAQESTQSTSPSGPRMRPSSVTCIAAIKRLVVEVLMSVSGRVGDGSATDGCTSSDVAQPLVADRCYARADPGEEASGGARQDQQRGRHRRVARAGLGDRHRAAPRRSLVQRRSRDRPAPRRRHAPDLARARDLPGPRRGGRAAPQVRLPLAAPGGQRTRRRETPPSSSSSSRPKARARGYACRKRLPAAGLGRGGQGPIRRRERRRLGPRARPTPRLRSRPRQQPDGS